VPRVAEQYRGRNVIGIVNQIFFIGSNIRTGIKKSTCYVKKKTLFLEGGDNINLTGIYNEYITVCRNIFSYRFTVLENLLGLQEIETPRISRQSAHEGCKVVSPTNRPPLTSRRYPWYLFLLEVESTPRP
jgi:hypothetical protein